MRVRAFAAMFLSVAALLMTAAMPAFAAPAMPGDTGLKAHSAALGDSHACGLGADPPYAALLVPARAVLTGERHP
ncbi:hypothetical protein [Arthrobacter sp. Alg241-R88]|uniref:hypothetical protein n=1 Tax=Arthrobacter sp. Alg241-R88 TaxID=2305984 RepID=UPI001966F049|nr:hypothetical protein [Arthrobacter sp. Alg241-R88]